MPTNEKKCPWCGHETLKLYHHSEYTWSDVFSLDRKNNVHVHVCIYCGKVLILDA